MDDLLHVHRHRRLAWIERELRLGMNITGKVWRYGFTSGSYVMDMVQREESVSSEDAIRFMRIGSFQG